jgi:hypothetical protein
MTYSEILHAIAKRDPNGDEFRPTPRDIAEFERWVVRNYGKSMLDQYNGK